MRILKSIIIDDELHGRNNLHSLLKSYCPEIDVIGKCGKPFEAKKMIYELKPDVVFLDINMPQLNGFELLDSLSEKDFLTVFVTAHAEFGIQAVKANAVDYLLKPIDYIELQQTVKKLISISENKIVDKETRSSTTEKKILVSHSEGSSLIACADIVKLEGNNNYTVIHFSNKKSLTVAKTLKEFETSIPEDIFFRIHKAEIINLNYVTDYTHRDGGYVTMKTGERIEISRRRFQDFEAVMKKFSGTSPSNHK
ncbi:MAG: response regulator [Ignavibacteriae bacterium]|nr:response regulator [Ignavibacteriota bacterium]